MKASRETARTSRAAAPSAAPAAPSAAPPARIATSQRPKRPQCRGTKSARPASISRVTTSPDRDPEHDLLGQQRRRRDEPAGEAREGVLLALERQRAGDQEDGDEGEGEGRGDGDREDFERRGGGVDHLLVDRDRLGRGASSSGAAVPRLLRASAVKRITWSIESRSGPGGSAGRSASRMRAAVAQAEDLDRLAEHVQLAAVEDEAEEFAPFGGDPPRDRQVGLGQQRVDPVVDQARLDRVLLVDDHLDLGRARGRRRERVDPVDQVGRQDQRRQHVAGAHLVDRFGPVLHVDALDPAADPVARPRSSAARSRRRLPGRRLGLR